MRNFVTMHILHHGFETKTSSTIVNVHFERVDENLSGAGRRLRTEGHKTEIRQLEDNLWGFSVEPKVGIGQRSLLIITRGAP